MKTNRYIIAVSITTFLMNGDLFGGVSTAVAVEPLEEKPYKLEIKLSLSGGYDSNPSSLGSGLSLPSGLDKRDSVFIESEALVSLTYDFARIQHETGVTNKLKFSYDFVADVYQDISGNNQNIHTAVAVYQRSLSALMTSEIRLTDKYLQSDGESIDNLFQVRPALTFNESKLTPILNSLQIAYAFSTYKFFPSGASVHDQDRHSLIAKQAINISDTFGAEFDLSYLHVWNSARGQDYDFDENAIETEFSTNLGPSPEKGQPEPFLHKFVIDVLFKYHFDRYSNLNSHSNFKSKRSDDYSQGTAVLTYNINKTVSLNVSYTYVQDASNIPVYHFDEHTLLGGFTVSF